MKIMMIILAFLPLTSLSQKKPNVKVDTDELKSTVSNSPFGLNSQSLNDLKKSLKSEKDSICYIINHNGIDFFNDGLAKVYFNEKGGYIDKMGQFITRPIYDWVGDFENKFAVCVKNKKRGFINRSGKAITEFKYDRAENFSENYLAAVCIENSCGFIDTTGKEVIPLKYELINSFSGGLAVVRESYRKTHIIDEKNQIVLPFIDTKYPYIGGPSGGLIQVGFYTDKKDLIVGCIDKLGNTKIPFEYESLDIFSEGLAIATKKKKYGVINLNGETIVPFIYDGMNRYSEGYAVCRKNNKLSLIDKFGKELLLDYKFTSQKVSEGLLCVWNGNLRGFIDTTGKIIIPLIYKGGNFFSDGRALVSTENESFYIDRNGYRVLSCR